MALLKPWIPAFAGMTAIAGTAEIAGLKAGAKWGHVTVHYWWPNRRLMALLKPWIPAFAGMTGMTGMTGIREYGNTGMTTVTGLKAGAK